MFQVCTVRVLKTTRNLSICFIRSLVLPASAMPPTRSSTSQSFDSPLDMKSLAQATTKTFHRLAPYTQLQDPYILSLSLSSKFSYHQHHTAPHQTQSPSSTRSSERSPSISMPSIPASPPYTTSTDSAKMPPLSSPLHPTQTVQLKS